MARPRKGSATAKAAAATETTAAAATETAATGTPAPETAEPKAAPKPKAVTVYTVNASANEEDAEKKAVKADSVGGVLLDVVSAICNSGHSATKAAILEEFRTTEKAVSIRAEQWKLKPQEYVNGYIDWLKGNRSLVSSKVEV